MYQAVFGGQQIKECNVVIVFTHCDSNSLNDLEQEANDDSNPPPQEVMKDTQREICRLFSLDSSKVKHFFQDSRPKNKKDLDHAQKVRANIMEMAFMADPLECTIKELPKPEPWLKVDAGKVENLKGQVAILKKQKKTLSQSIEGKTLMIKNLKRGLTSTQGKVEAIEQRLSDLGYGSSERVLQDYEVIRVENHRHWLCVFGKTRAEQTIRRDYKICDVELEDPVPRWMAFQLICQAKDNHGNILPTSTTVRYQANSWIFGMDGEHRAKIFRLKGEPTPRLRELWRTLIEGHGGIGCHEECNGCLGFCLCTNKKKGGLNFQNKEYQRLEFKLAAAEETVEDDRIRLSEITDSITVTNSKIEPLKHRTLPLDKFLSRMQEQNQEEEKPFSKDDLEEYIPDYIDDVPENVSEHDHRVPDKIIQDILGYEAPFMLS